MGTSDDSFDLSTAADGDGRGGPDEMTAVSALPMR
jgi:hypothetical protein